LKSKHNAKQKHSLLTHLGSERTQQKWWIRSKGRYVFKQCATAGITRKDSWKCMEHRSGKWSRRLV